MDLAAGFSFLGFGGATGLGTAGVSSSPKRSSSSFFFCSLDYSFFPLASLAGLSPTFFPPLNASWESFGSSVGPTILLAVATEVYQETVLGYFFLGPSPIKNSKATEMLLETDRSAIVRDSPTKYFFPVICF